MTRKTFAGLGLAAALFAGSIATPALAAPRDAVPGAKQTTATDISAASRKHWRGHRHSYRHRHYHRGAYVPAVVGLATAPFWLFGAGPSYGAHAYYEGGDRVAPIVRTPRRPYYAYNRYSGQVYRSCVIDLGYGRTQPCDAGGR